MSGGPARQLTDGKATNIESWLPAWSPNGREIVFSSSLEHSIYVMPSDGGEGRQVTKRRREIFFDWSPDGEWLVFMQSVQSGPQLWRVPAAGGNFEPLAKEG